MSVYFERFVDNIRKDYWSGETGFPVDIFARILATLEQDNFNYTITEDNLSLLVRSKPVRLQATKYVIDRILEEQANGFNTIYDNAVCSLYNEVCETLNKGVTT